MGSEREDDFVADATKKLSDAQDARELPPLTPDGVVSYNLMRARELRGYTQERAAELISICLGKTWSVPVFAAAERAHRTARVKEFSASELVAMSMAFDLPLSWWFLPPGPFTKVRQRSEKDREITGDNLLALLFPSESSQRAYDLEQRTEDLFNQFAAQAAPQDNLNTYMGYIQRRNAGLQSMAFSAFKAAGLENVPAELNDIARRWQQALNMLVSDLKHEGLPVTEEPKGPTTGSE